MVQLQKNNSPLLISSHFIQAHASAHCWNNWQDSLKQMCPTWWVNHCLTQPYQLTPPTCLVYINQPHHIAYTLDIQHTYFSLFFSLILWIHRKSRQQQHYRFIAHAYHFPLIFFSLPALESGRHTHRQYRIHIIYTHRHARNTPTLHMIDSPFIFLFYIRVMSSSGCLRTSTIRIS